MLAGMLSSCGNIPLIGLNCEDTARKLVNTADEGHLMELRITTFGMPRVLSETTIENHMGCLTDSVDKYSYGKYLGIKTKEGNFKIIYPGKNSREI